MAGFGYTYKCCIVFKCDHLGNTDEFTAHTVDELTENLSLRLGEDRVYMSRRNSQPGQSIFGSLEDAVENSEFFVILITPGFGDEQWTQLTTDVAHLKTITDNNRKRIIPILARNPNLNDPNGGPVKVPLSLSTNIPLVYGSENYVEKLIRVMDTDETMDLR